MIDVGPGPCAQVENDDGVVYAVHSDGDSVRGLDVGATVRVKVRQAPMRADCAGGIAVDAAWMATVD